MIECHGRVDTPLAAAYLERLCRHFAKKIPATWEGMRGTADFPFGRCEMEATADALLFRCAAPDEAAMAQLQTAIALHVGMFTKRAPLKVGWE
jgi:hypothetical protein